MHRTLQQGVIALTLFGSIGFAAAADEANPWKGEAQMPPPAASSEMPAPKETDLNTGSAESGPIGATGQTMPSKFSPKNQALDDAPLIPQK